MDSESELRQPLLLLVDDSRASRLLLASILKSFGQIMHASNGEQALLFSRESIPDIILLDIEMPEQSGIDVCQQLQSDPLTQDIPIIFVTGTHDPYKEVEGLAVGAVDFIYKPYHAAIIRARVSTQLKLKRLSDQLRQLVNLDGLTGLYNRRAFDNRLSVELPRHCRSQQPLGLVMIDVDHFKAYNDNYGHLAGDQCLKAIAHCLQQSARRAGDMVCRYGGEEFAIILPTMTLEALHEYGQWLCEQIRALQLPHVSSKTSPYVTISVGIATTMHTGISVEMLIAHADQALYYAKTHGRNQSASYTHIEHSEEK
ncbi:MAG: GGDEF domain-containing response regulator [Plesiomonas sp.]|uniref:GGDEF domain-containing response regulator n=1 Tax=Plesiomonas sp. TaxID=2486279 RepID=UPI003F39A7E1